MADMGIVQARTPEEVKMKANIILEQLGLNMSTYINMALNQLIMKRGIPFPVELPSAPASVNADLMTDEQIREKMIRGMLQTENNEGYSVEEAFDILDKKYE